MNAPPQRDRIRELWRGAVVSCAGVVAFDLSFEGSEKGWRSFREAIDRVAWHEAGHAIASLLFGFGVARLRTYQTAKLNGGVCSQRDVRLTPEELERLPGDETNAAAALLRLEKLGHPADGMHLIAVTTRLVKKHRHQIATLAAELSRKKELTGPEISQITGLPQPMEDNNV